MAIVIPETITALGITAYMINDKIMVMIGVTALVRGATIITLPFRIA